MTTQPTDAGALTGLTVLELGDEATQSCGKFFADMGATVVKIEPPEGSPSRHRGPFKDGKPDPNASIYFWTFNTSKDSITLDLGREEDRNTVRTLAARADILLEGYAPGYLDSIGLGYEQLSAQNPRLIVTSVTPFGQTGPLKDWKSTDMVNLAMGGAMWNLGYDDPDTPPLVPQGEFSYQFTGLWAGIGTLAALMARRESGEGQHVDVSLQEACAFMVHCYNTVGYEYTGNVTHRHDIAPTVMSKDGKRIVPQILNVTPDRWIAFRDWIKERGIGPELHEMDAKTLEANMPKVREAVQEIGNRMTAREMINLGQEFGFTWAAVNAPEELMEDEQLNFRGFFPKIEHPELGASYTYAGAPALWSEAGWRIRRRPPLLGEDNAKWGVAGR